MSIVVMNGGAQSTIQDLGRYGYQKDGFSVSGVMDRNSARLANILVDNAQNEAVLEFVLAGPKLRFTTSTTIAITGGDFSPMLNGHPCPMYEAVDVIPDDVIEFGFSKTGVWGYLAVSSEFDIPMVMGSKSTNLRCKVGGFWGRTIQTGDELPLKHIKQWIPFRKAHKVEPETFEDEKIDVRVILGPQDDAFTKEGIHTFLSAEYTVTGQCDRMGYRLNGPAIKHKNDGNIISDGIPLGAIQVPSEGQPIIMFSDRQTVGGYAKIACVATVDIPRLAQARTGTVVRFKHITVEEAQNLRIQKEVEIHKIQKKVQKFSWMLRNRTGKGGRE